MKKQLLVGILILFVVSLALSACASTAATSTAAAAESGANPPPQSTPPAGGPPPDGSQPPGGGQPPSGSPGGSSSPVALTAAYTVDGQSLNEKGQTYTASKTDESAIYVTNGGSLTASKATIITSGDSSSSDNSSFYGLNAGAVAGAGSTLILTDSTVATSGDGANGVFSTGEGASVSLTNVKIDATGQYAHAVMATQGGSLTLTNVTMTTAGASSGAIATDRGGGTITVTGGSASTSGANSPAVYSTGTITITGAQLSASGAEAAVIEGANSITLTDTNLSSNFEGKWGVMIYQSMSGDAQGTQGTFNMAGGSLVYDSATGPLFYITNSTGIITLKNVELGAVSGLLLKASAGNWGNNGSNGGTAVFTADNQIMVGDLAADKLSSITLSLQNGSSWSGAINTDKNAKAVSLSLDGTSTWEVTADSYITSLSDEAGIRDGAVSNIIGNGHTVYYDPSANPDLGGQTYNLNSGGFLTPMP